jgi:putative PIN family toxin of toxin-antitoxin system
MLDTNILISFIVFPNGKLRRLKQNLCEKHQIVICSYIIDEIKDVVARKFPDKENDMDDFFQSFPFTMSYTPKHFDTSAYPHVRDAFDLPILVSAILEDVDILITGDKDFEDVEVEKPEILTAATFFERYVVYFLKFTGMYEGSFCSVI